MFELEKMSAQELESLPRNQTLFVFPISPLEDHGPHLPLGLDLIESVELSKRIGSQVERELPDWKVVVMPAAPLGVQTVTTGLSVVVRPHVLRDWIVDACRSLGKQGFLYFACVSATETPKQITALEEAGKLLGRQLPGLPFWRRHHLYSLSSAGISAKEVFQAPFLPQPREHGGAKDTSLALALCEKLVKADYKTLPKRSEIDTGGLGLLNRVTRKVRGYWGDPASAQKEQGETLLEEKSQRMTLPLVRVLGGEKPRNLFRTYYSILPPNWSFFKAWVLILGTIGLFVIWLRMVLDLFGL